MKRSIMKLQSRISLVVILISVLCFGLLGFVSYKKISAVMVEQCVEDALGFAKVAASEIDGDWHESVMNDDTEEYRHAYNALKKYLGNPLITYIYTMRLSDDGLHFVIDTDEEDPADFLESYEMIEQIQVALNGEACFDKEKSEDEWGTYFSAYAPIFNSKGEVAGIVGADIDITDLNEKLKRLRELIASLILFFMLVSLLLYLHASKVVLSKDGLTSIHNYENMIAIGTELERKHKLQDYVGIIVNIKDFKFINHQYGAYYGDTVLKEFAQALSALCNRGEYVGRIGSDNFFFLVKKSHEDEVLYKVSKIDSVTIKFANLKKSIEIRVRCGICQVKPDYKIRQVINYCTLAIKTAHDTDKSDFVWYDDEMSSDMLKDKKMIDDFKKGLEEKEFVVFYQPKVNITKNEVCGAEALVRWIKNGKIIQPDKFIPLLEKEGKIVELDFYVFRKVCEDIKSWMDEGIKPVRVSSNFSKKHLDNPDFSNEIIKIADEYGVPHEYIDVELTESSGYSDFEAFTKFISTMRKNNICVSMDDFGTGYSSLSMLEDIDVDVVKIDKSFFRKMEDKSDVNSKLVENVIKMINDLNHTVICEGVETTEQADFLRSTDCSVVQGYLYDKPLDHDVFTERLKKPHYNI